MQKTYYDELDWFRGFAIFSIIYTHAQGSIALYTKLHWASSWDNIIKYFQMAYAPGGTWFFVYIAGFLFFAIFCKRNFAYGKFLKNKFLKVFTPYFLFVAAFAALRYSCEPFPGSLGQGIIDPFFFWSFWYIPFIMCVFILSPLFLTILSLKTQYQFLVLILSLILSMGVGRHPMNPVLSVVHFFPAYLLGILSSVHYNVFKNISQNIKLSLLFLTIIAMTMLIASKQPWEGFYLERWNLSFYKSIDWIVPIKLAFCLIWLWVFLWVKKMRFSCIKKILSILAKYSFTIFFFQQFAIFTLSKFPCRQFFERLVFWEYQGVALLASVVFCILTIAIFAPLKKLLGKYSRMILGC